jgi:hypothetical protein
MEGRKLSQDLDEPDDRDLVEVNEELGSRRSRSISSETEGLKGRLALKELTQ